MIEKKIRYDINIEKPSKTKPVTQGGVLNYLGKQKTVSAPVKWRSSPKHPIAKLAYITKDEEKILIDLDLYGSLKGKPNKGPFGLPSLQGSGSGSGGDGGGQGDSGPGGSDDGSGHGGPGPGSTGGPGAEGGFGIGPNAEAEATASNAAAAAAAAATAEGGFGIGPNAEAEAAQSVTADDVSAQAQADQEDAETAAAAEAAEEDTGIMSTLSGLAKKAIDTYMTYSPTVNAVKGLVGLVEAVVNPRGVTAPDDYSQLDTSVQSGPAQDLSGDGIVDLYAPLTNPTTGDNTVDAMRARLNALLDVKPTVYGIPAAVNKLSNYSLLDLSNLRK